MKCWLLTVAAAVCFLNAASAGCVNNPCTGTDYRSYSSCLSNQCPNTVIPPVYQPPVFAQPQPLLVQPPQVSGCYLYPINQCPQHCYGGCYWPRHSGCVPTQQWPFIRCGYGGSYGGGIGGIGGIGGYGGYGGYVGHGGYFGRIGYGGYGTGAQPLG